MGPQGETGPAGPAGPQGEPGPQSVFGKIYRVNGPIVAAAANAQATSQAFCNPGDSIISGGHIYNLQAGFVRIFSSEGDLVNNSWTAQFTATGNHDVMSIAYCFDNP
jgi:hypothetical protein